MQERRVVGEGAGPAGVFSPAVVAGGFVYVSGLVGTGTDGKLAGVDVASQARRVLDRLKGVLESAGSSMAQAVNINVFLKSAGDFEAMNTVYREYFADKPPARTTIVADLPDGALIQMSVVAVPVGAFREVLLPSGWMKSPRPYSYIVRAGDLVFFSGLVSRRGTDDQVVIGPVGVQTRTILDNAGTLLRTVGLTYSDVVSARVFLIDDTLFEPMNEEYRKNFSVDPPARATAVTGLMGVDAKVEISFIASTAEKRVIGPTVSPSLPVSTAVRAGPRVFLSGVLGNTDANAGDVPAQTREILARIKRTLDSEGLSFSNVVDCTAYMPDLWQRDAMDKVYAGVFPPPPPARTLFGARLATRAGLIELVMTAVK